MANDPWAAFPDATPTSPAPTRAPAAKPDPWADFPDAEALPAVSPAPAASRPVAPGGIPVPTGRVHDGDTFGLSTGGNARLYGADAFELNQTGRARDGATVPLGTQARDTLVPFAVPGGLVTPTGASTYGRPVASLSLDGTDAAKTLLTQGMGIATPEYLKGDPARLGEYMEAERDARLNRRGAWQTSFEQPSSYRHGTPDPWNPAAAPSAGEKGTAVFWDEPLPVQGLRPEIAKGYIDLWQDPASKPDDLLAYAKANGFSINADEVRRNYAARDKGGKAGDEVRYTTPPRVLTDHKDGMTGAALRGFADPINVLDEAGAIADTLLPGSGRENLWNSDRRFGDVYSNNLDQNRSILAYDDANHPYARFGGQLIGGVVMPGASVEGVGFGAARAALSEGATRFAAEQAARSAVVRRLGIAGAAEGGLAGVGQGEDWQGRATGGMIGTVAGAGLGTLTGLAAPKIAELVGRPFNKLAGAEGERVAGDFTDGAIDTARARASNDAADVADDLPVGVSPASAQPIARTQAMENETPRLSIDGPSVIGGPVLPNSRTRPLLDPASVDLRTAQAADLRPGDVLPVPNNTVASMDEAEAIAAGRLAPVRAPNEADELSRRTIPNATTGAPIAKRGPLDLVSWLRSEGGVRAQGGELERYGIDNAGRKGVDFAGGEQRLGRLVTNEGMTYDEAAERAWEAGFFPDHAERPTVAEFLELLADTHSGRQRAFLPDDLAEVDAFEAARRQRYEVEGARAAGAPLVEDRSVSAGYDDLDRNSPPVEAYEEWGENAPDFAGNIRLANLDSPQSIARALVHTEARAGGFDAATRGRITQAETKNLAADLGMTADDLLKRRKGQAFNAEEALAARQILARSATDLVNLARRVNAADKPGDELEAGFKEAWLRHVAIQEQVSGATAEAGRALASFRMAADASAVGRVLPTLGDIAGGTARLKDVAGKLIDLEKAGVGPGGVNRYAAKALQPRFRDKLVEVYYNSLLSGPQTHAVNILSNTITALGQIPEHAVAAGLGAVRGAVQGREADRVLGSEVGARAIGLIQGTIEGLKQGARTFMTGEPVDAVTKVEQTAQHAISGWKGSVIRTPTRALAAEDELFKAMARRMELTGLATRQAYKEGLNGAQAKRRIGELLENPTDDMLEKSFEYGRYMTFQNPLGDAGNHVIGLTESMPALKLIIPFVRTPTNILKFAIERSPAAPVLKEWRRDIAAGGAKRDLALSKVMVGSGIAAAVVQLASAGKITGAGPSDDNAKRLLQANGWQPYSLKVGDNYYAYNRLDPYATLIGTAADLVDRQSYMTEKQRENAGMDVLTSILKNLSSKTWLSGLSTALEALDDPDRNAENFVARTAGAVFVPGIVAQVARTVDPISREARSPMERVQSRIPGFSNSLPARRDVLGGPVQNSGGVGPDIISPIYTSTDRKDPLARALLESGVTVSKPSRGNMTPEQYDRYQADAGKLVRDTLTPVIGGPVWSTLSPEDRQDYAATVIRKARRTVRDQMGVSMKKAPTRRPAPGGVPAADPWAAFPDAR